MNACDKNAVYSNSSLSLCLKVRYSQIKIKSWLIVSRTAKKNSFFLIPLRK